MLEQFHWHRLIISGLNETLYMFHGQLEQLGNGVHAQPDLGLIYVLGGSGAEVQAPN